MYTCQEPYLSGAKTRVVHWSKREKILPSLKYINAVIVEQPCQEMNQNTVYLCTDVTVC